MAEQSEIDVGQSGNSGDDFHEPGFIFIFSHFVIG